MAISSDSFGNTLLTKSLLRQGIETITQEYQNWIEEGFDDEIDKDSDSNSHPSYRSCNLRHQSGRTILNHLKMALELHEALGTIDHDQTVQDSLARHPALSYARQIWRRGRTKTGD